MPWRSSSPMDLKTQFIADYLRKLNTISELCREYQISRNGLQMDRSLRGRRSSRISGPFAPSASLLAGDSS